METKKINIVHASMATLFITTIVVAIIEIKRMLVASPFTDQSPLTLFSILVFGGFIYFIPEMIWSAKYVCETMVLGILLAYIGTIITVAFTYYGFVSLVKGFETFYPVSYLSSAALCGAVFTSISIGSFKLSRKQSPRSLVSAIFFAKIKRFFLIFLKNWCKKHAT